jgi:hypothetical protein
MDFNAIYPLELVVGGTNMIRLTDVTATLTYLPAPGAPGVLTATVIDPASTSAGEFGGEVVALKLNVDFSSRFGNAVAFGDLRICKTSVAAVNGQTVAQFLATANQILGGGGGPFGASTANVVASALNNAFLSGTPSSFAQANLFAAATCPTN